MLYTELIARIVKHLCQSDEKTFNSENQRTHERY